MRRLALLGGLAAAALALAVSAATGARSSTLSLAGEWTYFPHGSNCMSEDSLDRRVYSGSLYGSYSTSFRLCSLGDDGVTAGGEGIQSSVGVNGTFGDLTITAPDGAVTHGIFEGSSQGLDRYEVCVCPPYYASTDTGTSPLPGGVWTITVASTSSKVSWEAQSTMTDVAFQQRDCPASERNIYP